MKLPAYKEILKMTKEKIDSTLAPIRASKAKAQANLEMCKLDEHIAVLEAEITELCTKQDISFSSIIDKARKEIAIEKYRAAVEVAKQRLRTKQSLFSRLFPFTIEIKRRIK